ncbi:(2Fe-2S)-binding protein [Paraburkholderia aspalathi]|nr:(2Fe-2S)-binding protein [Paraburkholderia aspalathi]MBK3821902.1 (2Fe-2S)-binding protein [Paraburkholderia aspalathi]MBK3833736.1 (2Fe-2S)-binding protein [Paraburkholderia aspalathi]MBK3863489.1 (2Fe-2S)-binding protein [Paraburkholderia aspalathi]
MVSISVNGKTVVMHSAPDTPLLWVLRCEHQLTGTKFGCGIGVCGACTVLLDNTARPACQIPISTILKSRVVTIEGLDSTEARALKKAWIECDVVQCGYCQSAQLIAATALLYCHRHPTDSDVDEAMRDIACRCGTFPRIRKAIHQAARSLRP